MVTAAALLIVARWILTRERIDEACRAHQQPPRPGDVRDAMADGEAPRPSQALALWRPATAGSPAIAAAKRSAAGVRRPSEAPSDVQLRPEGAPAHVVAATDVHLP
jgi:hypothetical protein